MIVVTDIKTVQTDARQYMYDIATVQDMPMVYLRDKEDFNTMMSYKRETIKAQIYQVRDKEIALGLCQKAQDVLGLPIEVFQNLQREIDYLREEVFRLRQGRSVKMVQRRPAIVPVSIRRIDLDI